MEKISNILLPVAEKLSKNRYLTAIRDGFISIMPLVITASVFILINSVFIGEGRYLDKWFGIPLTEFAKLGVIVAGASMSLMGLMLVFNTSKSLANHYNLDTSIVPVVAVAAFLCLTPFASDATLGEVLQTYYLGAAGMFTAFISALLAVEVMRFFLGFKALIIKMPDSVPTGIAKSFNAIIPVALTVIVFALLRIGTDAMGAPLNDLIFKWIQTPFTAIVTSPVGLVLIYVLYMLLWGFGIHTAYIFNPILEPIYLIGLTANANAVLNNATGTAIITKPFLDSVAFMGGAGNMFALVIAIFIASKREDYKVIAKIGLVPSLFNISEPLMFGLPVVMNPILIIPMILSTLTGLGLGALATSLGLMAHTYVATPWTTPPVLGAFLATGGDFLSALVALVILVLSVMIYLPFVITMNKETHEVVEK